MSECEEQEREELRKKQSQENINKWLNTVGRHVESLENKIDFCEKEHRNLKASIIHFSQFSERAAMQMRIKELETIMSVTRKQLRVNEKIIKIMDDKGYYVV